MTQNEQKNCWRLRLRLIFCVKIDVRRTKKLPLTRDQQKNCQRLRLTFCVKFYMRQTKKILWNDKNKNLPTLEIEINFLWKIWHGTNKKLPTHDVEINFLCKIWHERNKKYPTCEIEIKFLRKIWHWMNKKIADPCVFA